MLRLGRSDCQAVVRVMVFNSMTWRPVIQPRAWIPSHLTSSTGLNWFNAGRRPFRVWNVPIGSWIPLTRWLFSLRSWSALRLQNPEVWVCVRVCTHPGVGLLCVATGWAQTQSPEGYSSFGKLLSISVCVAKTDCLFTLPSKLKTVELLRA